jgi:hypothetical protein
MTQPKFSKPSSLKRSATSFDDFVIWKRGSISCGSDREDSFKNKKKGRGPSEVSHGCEN